MREYPTPASGPVAAYAAALKVAALCGPPGPGGVIEEAEQWSRELGPAANKRVPPARPDGRSGETGAGRGEPANGVAIVEQV